MPVPDSTLRSPSRRRLSLLTALLLVVLGVGAAEDVPLPPPLKDAIHPKSNPLTPAKAALGRSLFFDTRLSRDGRVACATCHDPGRGFSNGEAVAVGVGGKKGSRNVSGLVNVGYHRTLFWDGRSASLEEQALMPITNPAEMDMSPVDLAARLNRIESYREQFRSVFGGAATPERIAMALATYERTLVSSDTPFDRFLRGDRKAMSERSQRGMRLFFGQARCALCHKGASLSDDLFHNIGTANGPDDRGRRGVTGKKEDHGAFRTPQLREVGRTSPYMHNGKWKTLADVIRHYNFGGVSDERNDHRDPLLEVLYLSEDQEDDLAVFLAEGLTTPGNAPVHESPARPGKPTDGRK